MLRTFISPILVGRDSERQALAQLLEQAAIGQGQVVLVTGEAGVGKSRLLADAARVAAERGFDRLQGQCFEPDQSLPYGPLLDLLHGWIMSRTDDELAPAIGDSAPALRHLVPELARFATKGDAGGQAEPDKRRLFEAAARIFMRLANRAPLFVIFEDLHWADDLSLEFLVLLARRLQPQRIVLALSYRAEEVRPALLRLIAELGRLRLANEVGLRRLSRDQVELMIRAIFNQPQPVQSDFLDRLTEQTDGNPFFVEEVLKSLVEAGEIFLGSSGWTRKPVDELVTLHVRSAQEAVARRTQQLTEDARGLLTCAAVAGRRLDLNLLPEVSGLPQAELLPFIKQLIAAQMFVEEASGQLAFRHALIQQTIVGSLLAAERRALHARVVAAIETVYAAALDNHTPDLAHHSYEAGLWPQALCYSRAAGADALRLYAPAAAIEHLTHALEAARHAAPPAPAALYFARAQAYQLVGIFEPALADLEAALQISRAAGDRQAEWRALLDMGLLWTARDYGHAERVLRQALEMARTLDDPTALGHSLNRLGNYLTNLDRPDEALAYHVEALRIFDQMQNQHGLAETHDLTATALGAWGDWAKASTHYQQAEDLFRALDDRQGLASSLTMSSFRGGAYFNDTVPTLADPGTAQSDVQAALNLARQTGQRAAEAMAATAHSFCLGPQGEYDRALELARQGLALAEEIDHRHWTCFGRLALGALQLDLLELPAAIEQIEQARILAGELGSLFFYRMASAYLISVYTLTGELARAQTVFETTLDAGLPPRSGMERQVWASRVELALAQGQLELAMQCLDQLQEQPSGRWESATVISPRLAWLRGRALLGLDRRLEAEAALRAAEAGAEAQGFRPLLWRVLADLARAHQAQRHYELAAAALAAAQSLIEALAASLAEDGLRQRFVEQAVASLPAEPTPTSRQALKRRYGGLTTRERDVAARIAQGLSNRDIGQALVLSQRTVEVHVANIMTKLSVNTRAQIAVWVTQNGLLSGSSEK